MSREKRKYKDQKDALAAIDRIATYSNRDVIPVRAYREGRWWYITSKPDLYGGDSPEVVDVTPEMIKERLNALTVTAKFRRTGTVYDYRLAPEKISGIVRDAATGEFNQQELAEKWGVSRSTVGKVVSNWISDLKVIRQLREE